MAKGSPSNRYVEAGPRVRRGYFECRYGQLHVHNAIPPGGGFEEGTALLCLHRHPLSGRMFERFLALAGRDRSVYAPDLPGFGESDPPPTRPTILEYAAAIGDFLDSMRFRQIDVLGVHHGTLVAVELAVARPKQIRRVVAVSIPMLTEAERESFRRAASPVTPAADGSHLADEWRRTVEAYGPGAPLELATRAFAEKLRNSTQAAWAAHAAVHYPVRERLGMMQQPVLVLRPRDDLGEATPRVRELLLKARCVDLPEQGPGLLDTAPEVVADAIRDFLGG